MAQDTWSPRLSSIDCNSEVITLDNFSNFQYDLTTIYEIPFYSNELDLTLKLKFMQVLLLTNYALSSLSHV